MDSAIGTQTGSLGGYRKMSESEIDTECFDQALVTPATPRRPYVICSTQRSGSWLLCRQLINAGLGVPHEYFHSDHIAHLCARWRLNPADPHTYLDALHNKRTTPNGVWGAKLQWGHYQCNKELIDQRLFKSPFYIFLYRSDLVTQAVSLHISLVTGIWGFDGVKLTEGIPGVTLGDRDHVVYCGQAIRQDNEWWQALFRQRAMRPLVIRYEDFVGDQAAMVRRIGQYLGLAPSQYRVPSQEPRENSFPADIDKVRQDLVSSFKREKS